MIRIDKLLRDFGVV